jgi:transcriptional regulator with XRE-family HTH domain
MNAVTFSTPPTINLMGATNFGEWLKKERLAKNLSGRDLAVIADTTHASVSRFETGDRNPSRRMAAQLAEALGADPREALEALMADTPGLAPAPELEPQNELERRAIAAFSKLSDEEQESVLLLVERIAGITKD